MELYTIPLDGDDADSKFILYRPLAGLAFVGNRAMADLAVAAAQPESAPMAGGAAEFLQAIGFLEPDPAVSQMPETKFKPTTAVLLLTNQCQLRCTYCYASAGDFPKQELSVELGQAVIDYVCQTAMELGRPQFEVSFHGGGEPTFAWHVLQACAEYARQKPLPSHLTLTSNGLWSPQQCEWILDHLDGVSLSLDGDPETQNRQRPLVTGAESSPLVMRSVAELDRRKFPYGVRMTTTAPFTNLPKAVRFICEETGCQSMQVEPAFNTVRGPHSQAASEEAQAFAEAFLEAFDIAFRAKRQLHYSGARLGVITAAFCIAPYGALIVNGNGELVTCYEVSGPNHPLAQLSIIGRVENGQVNIDETARNRLHSLMAERRATCQDCYCYWSCAGDCYTRTFGKEAGDHLRHGARCDINQTITRELLLGGIAGGEGVWRYKTGHQRAGQTYVYP